MKGLFPVCLRERNQVLGSRETRGSSKRRKTHVFWGGNKEVVSVGSEIQRMHISSL